MVSQILNGANQMKNPKCSYCNNHHLRTLYYRDAGRKFKTIYGITYCHIKQIYYTHNRESVIIPNGIVTPPQPQSDTIIENYDRKILFLEAGNKDLEIQNKILEQENKRLLKENNELKAKEHEWTKKELLKPSLIEQLEEESDNFPKAEKSQYQKTHEKWKDRIEERKRQKIVKNT